VARWKGGASASDRAAAPAGSPRSAPAEDTLDLIRRLAAGTTPTRHRRDSSTGSQRRTPADCHTPPVESIAPATHCTSPATRQRWQRPGPRRRNCCSTCRRPTASRNRAVNDCCAGLNGRFIAREQITHGAPGRIARTNQLRRQAHDTAPAAAVPSATPPRPLGVSRPEPYLKKVKRGELRAVLLTRTGTQERPW